MAKLLRVVPSEKADKKWKAIFESDAGREKITHFGARGMQDYTMHHDQERRKLYRARHKKDLATGDPTRAGFLSYYLLWGDSTNLSSNIESYRRRFHL